MSGEIVNLLNKKLLFEEIYQVDSYHTIKVSVTSSGFSGVSNFCISEEGIQVFLENLKKLSSSLEGCTELKDYDSDAYIKVAMEKHGALSISGQIGSSYEDHFLKFHLESDQTILDLICKYFDKILKRSKQK